MKYFYSLLILVLIASSGCSIRSGKNSPQGDGQGFLGAKPPAEFVDIKKIRVERENQDQNGNGIVIVTAPAGSVASTNGPLNSFRVSFLQASTQVIENAESGKTTVLEGQYRAETKVKEDGSFSMIFTSISKDPIVLALGLPDPAEDKNKVPLDKNDIAVPGDINGDGCVDFTDLNILLSNYNTSVLPGTNGDLDNNGIVDFSDLGILLNLYHVDNCGSN